MKGSLATRAANSPRGRQGLAVEDWQSTHYRVPDREASQAGQGSASSPTLAALGGPPLPLPVGATWSDLESLEGLEGGTSLLKGFLLGMP